MLRTGSVFGGILWQRKEQILFLAALPAAALIVLGSVSGWFTPKELGETETLHAVRAPGPAPKVETRDFSVWTKGGRNPFVNAAGSQEAGGRVRIPLPPPPPLAAELPPAPTVPPLDLVTEGAE